MTENGAPAEIEVSSDNPDDIDGLYVELRGTAGITVEAVTAPIEPGEQGAALDLLMVALSSGAVTAFLQIVKALADARGPKFVLKIRRGRDQLTITADNFDAVEPAIRRLLGQPWTNTPRKPARPDA
jgi:hypothetical protein